jgi:aryl-alcohol dehydrogenase-like predicted oxidoreductase
MLVPLLVSRRCPMSTHTLSLLAGKATGEGTRAYHARFAERFSPDFVRQLDGDLLVSSLGLGTYLGECDDAEDARYAAAVREAVSRGVNLVDTAINYRCQRSERAVGAAIHDLLAAGTVRREELVVCTKGGYLPLDASPPATRAEYHAYLEREFFAAGVMMPEEVVAGGHCLSPSYLAHQITASQANLGLATLDVYYLHNPEQQLAAVEPARFRDLIRDAFALLEERVAAGDVGRYGCATWNGLRVAPGTRGHVSLAELVEIAREVGGDGHHFRVVQLPINLAMSEAVRQPTQLLDAGHGKAKRARAVPLLEAAYELGIAVVASAPLMQAQLTRGLPEALQAAFPGLATDAQRAIAFVRTLPGVCAALVGMKSAAHLEENLAAA